MNFRIPKLYRLSGAETLGRIPIQPLLHCVYVLCVCFKERCENGYRGRPKYRADDAHGHRIQIGQVEAENKAGKEIALRFKYIEDVSHTKCLNVINFARAKMLSY
ncbi:hypothetical protein NQ317_017238 [Molorchus minor]|uniref:Uncharacterized protein n=1 Tax=Molorchus minor TaxID=1323400 RepID=A0ABQ9JFY6_9CUCU|nr:hypothetical protein NQ317_017238 [Molorchus minor]